MPSLLDIVIVAVIVLIMASIAYYLYREKKKGHNCVGCPYAGQCGGGCSDGCGHDTNKSL